MIELLNFDIETVLWSTMLALLWIIVEYCYKNCQGYVTKETRQLIAKGNCGKKDLKRTKASLKNAESKSQKIARKQTIKFLQANALSQINFDIKYLSRTLSKLSPRKGMTMCRGDLNMNKITAIIVRSKSNDMMPCTPLEEPLNNIKIAANIGNLRRGCDSVIPMERRNNSCRDLALASNSYSNSDHLPQRVELSKFFNLFKSLSWQDPCNLLQKLEGCISIAPGKVVLTNAVKDSPDNTTLSCDQVKSFLLEAILRVGDSKGGCYKQKVFDEADQFRRKNTGVVITEIEIVKTEKPRTKAIGQAGQVRQKKKGVVITEIECENYAKMRTETDQIFRLKRIAKRRHKQRRQDRPVFSSKQCFARLAYYMSTRKKYSSTNLTMEIEKEMQPIKEQIKDLHNSLVDFSVITCRSSETGVKSSTIFIEPTDRKQKTVYTISSHSDYDSQIDYFAIEPVKRKLSPLAEMYVKLAQHK